MRNWVDELSRRLQVEAGKLTPVTTRSSSSPGRHSNGNSHRILYKSSNIQSPARDLSLSLPPAGQCFECFNFKFCAIRRWSALQLVTFSGLSKVWASSGVTITRMISSACSARPEVQNVWSRFASRKIIHNFWQPALDHSLSPPEQLREADNKRLAGWSCSAENQKVIFERQVDLRSFY